MLMTAAFFCATRERMQTVGEWAEDRCGRALERRSDPFFGSFHACPPFFSVLDETDKVVSEAHGTPVFFGPRMEFLYARDRLASPKGLPVWWHPGTSFPVGAEPAIFQAWKGNHFGLLIFLHNDRTRVPPVILDAIERDYVETTISPPDPDALDDAKIDVYIPRKQ